MKCNKASLKPVIYFSRLFNKFYKKIYFMHTKAQNLNNIILIFENFLGAKTRMLHSGAGALYTAFKSSSHLQFIAFFFIDFNSQIDFKFRRTICLNLIFFYPKSSLMKAQVTAQSCKLRKKILETPRPCG